MRKLLVTSLLLLPQMSLAAGLVDAITAVEEINSMRQSLVSGVVNQPDATTFKNVCKPVGIRAKELTKKYKWKFRQVSEKNRNPKNKPNGIEKLAIKKFQDDKNLKMFWQTSGEKNYLFRRITVRKQCLACHGAKDSRPEFVSKKYPGDRAFGFSVNDLRGIYSVEFN